jgi:peptide chain release factor 2
LEDEIALPTFWDGEIDTQQVFKKLTILKESYEPWYQIMNQIKDINEFIELYKDEGDDAASDLVEQINILEKNFEPLKVSTLLNGKFDNNDVFLTVHSGSGGDDASDWANILLRMYLRWCEKKGYKQNIIDIQEDVGGIKSCTVQISGPHAFGYLKGEAGVHRLVRISPFDSQKRRHTSFSSVYASPVMDDDIEIEIKPEDYRLDTYRAGGAGGQHVNKTDSAVRITHYASGIVVQCQNERSQHMNKELAFKMLRSKLYEYYENEREKEHQSNAIAKKEITWGSQIRSYVFQPYTMVKDHRTGYQTGSVNSVMDGDIDGFIQSYLQWLQEE